MRHFAWIPGAFLACSFGAIIMLAFEHVGSGRAGQEDI